jgi:hypothetical protein
MRCPVAGVLVGPGAVAALVGPQPLVHVAVTNQRVLVGKALLAGLTPVGQLLPGGVISQYVAYHITP